MPGARGEGILHLAEGERPVLFTNRALADAERLTGKTVLQLMTETQSNALGIGDTAILLQVGMEHARREGHLGNKQYNLGDAYTVLDEVGFTTVARLVMEALVAVLSYDREEPDNPPA